MAKKSRRRKLPTEKDFERLNNPQLDEPESAKDKAQPKDAQAEASTGVEKTAYDANEATPDADVDTRADGAADEVSETKLTYSIDGGMEVSLSGDATGAEALTEAGAIEDDVFVDQGTDDAENDEFLSGRGVSSDAEEEPDDEEEEDIDDEPRPPEVLILVGSPRKDGKSALFGHKLSEYLRLSGAAVTLYEIAKYPVAACTGCGVCSETGLCCIKGDAWNVLSRHMNSCAALVVIAPIYFAGPSGWLKAALDRCQVYWARKYVLKDWIPRKRPAHLLVIGDGGDPYGSEPLETICTSALNCANLRIVPERITRMIGDQFDLRHAVTLAGQVMASIGRE